MTGLEPSLKNDCRDSAVVDISRDEVWLDNDCRSSGTSLNGRTRTHCSNNESDCDTAGG